MGGCAGDTWIMADSAAQYINGGERYSIYSMFGQHTVVKGQKPHNSEMGACPEMLTIEIDSFAGAEDRYYAFTGDWNALPRVPDTLKVNNRINNIVRNFLKKNKEELQWLRN